MLTESTRLPMQAGSPQFSAKGESMSGHYDDKESRQRRQDERKRAETPPELKTKPASRFGFYFLSLCAQREKERAKQRRRTKEL